VAALLTQLAAGVDGLVLRGARVLIDRTIMPPPDEAERLRESSSFYTSARFVENPRAFFAFLDDLVEVPAVEELASHPLRGGRRIELRYASRYHPVHPEHSATFAEQTQNQSVPLELWRHDQHQPASPSGWLHGSARGGRKRPTLIALHGFGMGYPRIDAPALMVPEFYAMGLDVALISLPLHGARTPATARFSGQAFATPDVVQINEALGQAVHDVASLVLWLRRRGRGSVGLLGLSLGGYVAALMAGLCGDLDFVVPIVAPVCFGDLADRFMAGSSLYRGVTVRVVDREALRAGFRVHSPLAHPLRLERERALIVAGNGDRVVPPDHPRWLWEHWGRPPIHWFDGSHLLPFGRRRTRERIRTHLAGLGLLQA